MLPSTEYALIRLLLKHHKTDILLAILADPINYGIFLNEHSACLVIDSFLEAGKITDAARIASCVMLQEMFQSTLLNWLCIYSSLRWTELSVEKECSRNFRPWIYYQLIGKNLLWFSNCVPINEKEVGNIRLIGSVFFGNYVLANQLLQTTNIFSSVATICQSKLQQITIKTDDVRKLETIVDKVERNTDEKLSDMIIKHLKTVQNVETLDLKLRLKETCEGRQKLRDRWEMLNFFENRLKWEDMAAVKAEFLKAEEGKRKSKEDLEREYISEVFHNKSAKKS
nr:Bm8371, isoform c [Brugia malayi]